jgi:hypothetical protein
LIASRCASVGACENAAVVAENVTAASSGISAATPLKPLIIEKILFVIAAPSLQPKRDLQRARKK